MAEWPDLDTLKRALDVDNDAFDTELEGVLASAIEQVKTDVAGSVDSFDDEDADPVYTVTDSLAEAARLLAVRLSRAPGESAESTTWAAHRQDVQYQRLLKGQRRTFGVG